MSISCGLLELLRIVFEIMDYGSHGTDRTKYRMDLNRGLFLQAQDCTVFYISLDELKENPVVHPLRIAKQLVPLLSAGDGTARMIKEPYSKIERDLMRRAIRHNRVIRPIRGSEGIRVAYDDGH